MNNSHQEYLQFLRKKQQDVLRVDRFSKNSNSVANSDCVMNDFPTILSNFFQFPKDNIQNLAETLTNFSCTHTFCFYNSDKFLKIIFDLIKTEDCSTPAVQAISSLIYSQSPFVPLLLKDYRFLDFIFENISHNLYLLKCLQRLIAINDISLNKMICNEQFFSVISNLMPNPIVIDTISFIIQYSENNFETYGFSYGRNVLLQFNSDENFLSVFKLFNVILSRPNINSLIFDDSELLYQTLSLLSSKIISGETIRQILYFFRKLSTLNFLPTSTLIDGGLYSVLSELSLTSNEYICEILSILSNIASFGHMEVNEICEYGFVELINECIENGYFKERIEAISLASNILYKGDCEHIKLVMNEIVFNSFCECLTSDQYEMKLLILDSILYALNTEKECESRELHDFLINSQYIGIIEELTYKDEQAVAEIADKIIDHYK